MSSSSSRILQFRKNIPFFLDCLTLDKEGTTFLQNIRNRSPDDTVYVPGNVNPHWVHPNSRERKKVIAEVRVVSKLGVQRNLEFPDTV